MNEPFQIYEIYYVGRYRFIRQCNLKDENLSDKIFIGQRCNTLQQKTTENKLRNSPDKNISRIKIRLIGV